MSRDDIYIQLAKTGKPIEDTLVIDSHMHLGEYYLFPVIEYQNLSLLVSTMDRIGVNVGVISSLPACLGGKQKEGNDFVIKAIKKYPRRFIGSIGINPHYSDLLRPELKRCFQAGMRAIKIHSKISLPYSHKNYKPVYGFADEKNLPILAHTWGKEELGCLEPRFKKYPKLKWLLAHTGSNDLTEYVRLAKKYNNVFLEIALSSSPRGLIEYLVSEGLENKILFGSDCYFMNLAQQIGRVMFAKISLRIKEKILGKNAQKIFRI